MHPLDRRLPIATSELPVQTFQLVQYKKSSVDFNTVPTTDIVSLTEGPPFLAMSSAGAIARLVSRRCNDIHSLLLITFF
jgi:hypothetical protein